MTNVQMHELRPVFVIKSTGKCLPNDGKINSEGTGLVDNVFSGAFNAYQRLLHSGL